MNTRSLFIIFVFIVFFKVLLLWLFFNVYGQQFFGGGNDSDYYDAYALGYDDVAANVWPIILRFLNEIGLYSRGGVSGFLMFLGVVVVPFLAAKLAVIKGAANSSSVFWLVAIVVSAYPTLFYYTLDIYRDVFMVFVFLLGLILVRKFINGSHFLVRFFIIICIFLIGLFLFLLRSYLGFGFASSFFMFWFYSFSRWSLLGCFILFLFGINLMFSLGLFESVLLYRNIFSNEMQGGSNFGIVFESNGGFLLDFAKNFYYQIFGLYFSNMSAVIVFFVETVPFFVMFVYLIRNRQYADKFVDYLIIFFVMYSTIWLLGNDNLGTAVRLRMYSYISIIIACMIVFQRKKNNISLLSEHGTL